MPYVGEVISLGRENHSLSNDIMCVEYIPENIAMKSLYKIGRMLTIYCSVALSGDVMSLSALTYSKVCPLPVIGYV